MVSKDDDDDGSEWEQTGLILFYFFSFVEMNGEEEDGFFCVSFFSRPVGSLHNPIITTIPSSSSSPEVPVACGLRVGVPVSYSPTDQTFYSGPSPGRRVPGIPLLLEL